MKWRELVLMILVIVIMSAVFFSLVWCVSKAPQYLSGWLFFSYMLFAFLLIILPIYFYFQYQQDRHAAIEERIDKILSDLNVMSTLNESKESEMEKVQEEIKNRLANLHELLRIAQNPDVAPRRRDQSGEGGEKEAKA